MWDAFLLNKSLSSLVSGEVPAGIEVPAEVDDGGGGGLDLTLLCHHHKDFCVETGIEESRFGQAA